MKQINPLHLIGVLSAILILMLFSLNSLKEDTLSIKQEIVVATQLADDIAALKKSWGNKKSSKNKILKILNNQSMRSAGVSYKVSSSKITIDAQSIEQKNFNHLMNKLLNGAFNITQMKLRQLDKTHISMNIEVML